MQPKSLNHHIVEFGKLAEKQRDYRPLAMKSYAYWTGRFAEWAGQDATLENSFTPKRLRDYKNYLLLEKRYKPNSLATIYSALRAFAAWLLEEERIAEDPTPVLGKVKFDRTAARIADDEAVIAMLHACRHYLNPRKRALAKAVLCVLTYGGLRRNELLSLQVNDLVPDPNARGQWKLIVREGKGGSYGEVPICSEAVAAIEEWKRHRPDIDTEFLFVQNRRGPLSGTGIYNILKQVAHLAERDYTNPHSFRHGLITRLLRDSNNDIKTVSQIARHRSVKTTLDSYAHTTDMRLRRAADSASLESRSDASAPPPSPSTPSTSSLPPLRLVGDK